MKRFLSKTFGGLETSYYLRHLFFGLAMTILFSWGMFVSDNPAKWTNISAFVAFGVLYPYSRFVYESVLGFVFGENVFFVNAFLLLITKNNNYGNVLGVVDFYRSYRFHLVVLS